MQINKQLYRDITENEHKFNLNKILYITLWRIILLYILMLTIGNLKMCIWMLKLALRWINTSNKIIIIKTQQFIKKDKKIF